MTVQFSRQAIAAFLHLRKIAKTGSCLVRRLVRAQNDPGKERIRKWLIDLDDAQLRSGLGPDAGRHCCPARWYAASLPDGGLSPRTAAGGYTRGIGRGRGALTAVSKKHAWIVPDPNESANEARPRLGKAPRRDIRHRLKIAGTEGEIDSAFAALPRLQAGALIVTTSELFSRRRERLVTLAAHHAVPEVYPWREAATAGP